MNDRAPRVTVGIPFYNEERFLGRAVRSVLAQSEQDLELYLVDDGSTDHSLAIARSFDDPRVVVLSDGLRRHLPARLNEIVRRARAPLVARMDADDISHPERLARELSLLAADARCDAVGTWVGLVDHRGGHFAVVEAAALPSTPAVALTRGLLPHATLLARREWLLANPYDEALTRAQDADLWCRTVSTSRFAVVPEPLYVVRVSTDRTRFVADYLKAQRHSRALVLRYGPGALGRSGTARAWLVSYGKSVVMRVASTAGLAENLVRLRGRQPTARERAMVAEALGSEPAEPAEATQPP